MLALLWITGAFAMLSWRVTQHLGFTRRMRKAELITDPAILAALAKAQSTLGVAGSVRLMRTNQTVGPAVFGIFRPRLLLPNHLSVTLSDSELQHVLLHELVHIRRRDVLLNWVWISLQAWHWFNPVLWPATPARTVTARSISLPMSSGGQNARPT